MMASAIEGETPWEMIASRAAAGEDLDESERLAAGFGEDVHLLARGQRLGSGQGENLAGGAEVRATAATAAMSRGSMTVTRPEA